MISSLSIALATVSGTGLDQKRGASLSNLLEIVRLALDIAA
jgi:hypothetical protein